ncbi:zinc finger CCCH domain-containing protein [Cymbomonas tetramitiformis]|uniref:Zinc finger CCCH domain-containing protein n=1 Tax=Cymbomonas tetramitiformis TaxID=36881 RepID=A0AAE0L831_9CHLO|nr:zinc finger CCCH domain-containing protein [Cymbomonas tetramitiformis]
MSPLEDPSQDCEHYLRTGYCRYGAQCRYRHPTRTVLQPAQAPQSPKACHANGNKTAVASSQRTSNSSAPSTVPPIIIPVNSANLPLRPGVPECNFFLRTGTCKYGVSCKFHHPESPPLVEAATTTYVAVMPHQVQLGPSGVLDVHSYSNAPRPPWNSDLQYHFGGLQHSFQPQSINGVSASGAIPQENAQLQTVHMQHGQFGELPVRFGQKDCSFYLKTGHCKFGPSCKYNHPQDRQSAAELAGIVSCKFNGTGLPLRQGCEPCPYYLRTGSCRFGPTCKFDHPDLSAAGYMPCLTNDPAVISAVSWGRNMPVLQCENMYMKSQAMATPPTWMAAGPNACMIPVEQQATHSHLTLPKFAGYPPSGLAVQTMISARSTPVPAHAALVAGRGQSVQIPAYPFSATTQGQSAVAALPPDTGQQRQPHVAFPNSSQQQPLTISSESLDLAMEQLSLSTGRHFEQQYEVQYVLVPTSTAMIPADAANTNGAPIAFQMSPHASGVGSIPTSSAPTPSATNETTRLAAHMPAMSAAATVNTPEERAVMATPSVSNTQQPIVQTEKSEQAVATAVNAASHPESPQLIPQLYPPGISVQQVAMHSTLPTHMQAPSSHLPHLPLHPMPTTTEYFTHPTFLTPPLSCAPAAGGSGSSPARHPQVFTSHPGIHGPVVMLASSQIANLPEMPINKPVASEVMGLGTPRANESAPS